MAEAATLKPPSTMKEALAALIAVGVVLGGAQLSALLLKGLVEDGVRSSVTGMVFASAPAVYGFSNRALNGFRSKRLEFPDLLPWYVTGFFAGACLFAWIQFVSLVYGFALGATIHALGVEMGSFDIMQLGTGIFVVTNLLLIPAAFVAGVMINQATRGWAMMAVFVAAILCVAFSVFLNMTLAPDILQRVFDQMKQQPLTSLGFAIPAMVVLIFGGLGVAWSKFRRERSLGKLTHAARRLKPAERDQTLDEIIRTLAEKAKAPE